MNLPKAFVSRDDDQLDFFDKGVTQILWLSRTKRIHSGLGNNIYWTKVTVAQCKSYVNAIKVMKGAIPSTDNEYRPMNDNRLRNYGLESADGSRLLWARVTRVLEFSISDKDCEMHLSERANHRSIFSRSV
ncbi:hypothetical protein QBC45DRAFT_429340 [Copromyces sp. CBS 386.78]|nr:hypothetical protein QBC45DRAFT_429340 [Copromyces sp. CBS 386.78]